MPAELLVWLITLVFVGLVVTQRLWEPRLPGWWAWLAAWSWFWPLLGYPLTVVRMRVTWRRLSNTAGLSVVKRPKFRVIGDQAMRGMALRPIPAWLGLPRPTRTGLTVRVRLHPGQTPAIFMAAADAIAHAWRVHAARVTSPRRGVVLVTVTARDPLAASAGALSPRPVRLLTARVGRSEDGGPWILDLRREPHWLITGATQSGKSTLMASLVCELAPQAVALVGVDCKGGLELSLFQRRLTALAGFPHGCCAAPVPPGGGDRSAHERLPCGGCALHLGTART